MGPIVFLKNFTVAMDASQTFRTDWVSIPSEHQNGTLHAHVQTLSPATPGAGLGVIMEGSFDTVEEINLGTGITVIATGSYNDPISANIAPLGRIKLDNLEGSPIFAIVSVWLQPKSE